MPWRWVRTDPDELTERIDIEREIWALHRKTRRELESSALRITVLTVTTAAGELVIGTYERGIRAPRSVA